MWAQVYEIQDNRTPKALLDNIFLLFGLYQGSTQDIDSYLVTIRNLILLCKSVRKELSNPLVNMIVYQHHPATRR